MNTELKTFEFKQEFKGIDELYRFLIKNIDFIENKIGIRIGEEGLLARPFCITGKEKRIGGRECSRGRAERTRLMPPTKKTERQILFYASENTLPENLGELIILAAAFNADILVFIVNKINPTILEPIEWLKNAFHQDMELILAEARIIKNLNSIYELYPIK